MASFEYNLVPLPSGACFAGVNYLGTFNASSYDGVKIKLRKTGKNEWFKVIFRQKHSYEYLFKVSTACLVLCIAHFAHDSFLVVHFVASCVVVRRFAVAVLVMRNAIFDRLFWPIICCGRM